PQLLSKRPLRNRPHAFTRLRGLDAQGPVNFVADSQSFRARWSVHTQPLLAEVLYNPGAVVKGMYSLRAIVLAAFGAMTLPGETHDAVHALPFFWRHRGADCHAVASPDALVAIGIPPLARISCDPGGSPGQDVVALHLSSPAAVTGFDRRGLQNHFHRLPPASCSGFIILCTCA